ncbi:hypothetical protein GPJ56_005750 [Histomonas meleagridis]|uniref:uncharacterized protein n=1 Tax=Histomonas meleagridis TaxID=135588 RepID=UPI00355ACBD1|nr:hypothetical protein GPJ56_005750 [Histomonas meleagridis]KAH0803313.1 hypothetical protein GO595_003657 [Histomonas meleagridis]
MKNISTSWFVSQPDYNQIDIINGSSADEEYETNQNVIDDSSDFESDSSDIRFHTNDEKLMHESNFNDRSYLKTQNSKCSTLADDLELLTTLHYNSVHRMQMSEKLASQARSSMKYQYFSDSDDIPSQCQVESTSTDTKTETENKSTTNTTTKDDQLNHVFLNFDYIPPISQKRYEELNSRNTHKRETPPEIVAMKKTKVRMPADYMEFNERRHPKPKPTNTKTITSTKQTKPKHKQFTPSTQPIRQRPKVPIETKPKFKPYKYKEIKDNPPEFLSRPKQEHERTPAKTQQTFYKERKIRKMPSTPIQPIAHVEKKVIPNNAPNCVKHPEMYQHKKETPNNSTITFTFNSTTEQQLTDRKSCLTYLNEQLQNSQEVTEFKAPNNDFEFSSTFNNDYEDDESTNFSIPDEFLTETEGEIGYTTKRKTYFDPHETKAVKMRNQHIKQKLALREMQKEIEEKEEDERKWKQKEISKAMTPILRKLEQKVQIEKEDIEERKRREYAEEQEKLAEYYARLRNTVERTGFLVNREEKILERKGKENAKKKQEKLMEKKKQSEKTIARERANKRHMIIWSANPLTAADEAFLDETEE